MGIQVEQQTLPFEDVPGGPEKRGDNAVALFALNSIRGVGFGTIKSLHEEFKGDLRQVFKASEDVLTGYLYDARTPNPAFVVSEIKTNSRALISEGRRTWNKYQQDRGVQLLFRSDPAYPQALLDLPSPPSWLFVEGDANLLQLPFLVGFVGTRAPTPEGEHLARRAAACLARMGLIIVSGLAEGIDAVGHQTAVLYGAPTVAVLGHGIDVIFPRSTAATRQEIVRYGGAVVSEYLPTDSYSGDKFVQRNRIQAALSKAVCFVEAREKSGTAHTYRFARNLNRAAFGVVAGAFRGVPEEELISLIQAENGPVFDVTSDNGVLDLQKFIHHAMSGPTEKWDGPTQMFMNILREVKRLADEYDATPAEIKWLAKEIGKLSSAPRSKVESQTTNARRTQRRASKDRNP